MDYRQIILEQSEEIILDKNADFVQREKKEDIEVEDIQISIKPVTEWIFEQING